MHLIIGGDSTIGAALSSYWRGRGVAHKSTTRRKDLASELRPYLDLANPDFEVPDAEDVESVVFCAAVSNVAQCEANPASSRIVNVESTAKLVQAYQPKAELALLLSTSRVFDGTKPNMKPSDAIGPRTEYGRQKADAERLFLEISNGAVLRLSKVVHPKLAILTKWQEDIEEGRKIAPFKDMYLSPVSLDCVVARINCIVFNRIYGVSHLSGGENISYYEFAKTQLKDEPRSPDLIEQASAYDSSMPEHFIERYSNLMEK